VRRRDFISLIAGGTAAAAWPLIARAQRAAKLPIIGMVSGSDASTRSAWVGAFVRRLRELGWVEGRDVAIEYRWADGHGERVVELAAELVRLKVAVIVTTGGPLAGVRQATSVIPIVFATANDPVGAGLVESLARPGGNLTGLSLQATDIAGKRLQLLRQVAPTLRRLAVLVNGANPSAALELKEVSSAAHALGVQAATLDVRRDEDILQTLATLKGQADALYVCSDPLFAAKRVQINDATLDARLPTMYAFREPVEAGGLMSYGPNFPDMFRRAAEYVDKILRGAKPGGLPVEQPTKFDLVVNLTRARTLGLTIPDQVLALADEVIE
jgi:putative tryptophan/tyrosine transport system substrate-binding protein